MVLLAPSAYPIVARVLGACNTILSKYIAQKYACTSMPARDAAEKPKAADTPPEQEYTATYHQKSYIA
jgi:hypothetical protein